MFAIEHDSNATPQVLAPKNLRWFAAGWGLLGLLSIILPVASTVAVELMLASVLMFAGGYRMALALSHRDAERWRWSLMIGALVAAVGILMLLSPAAGAMTITMMLIAFFLLEAALALMLAFSLKAIANPNARKWLALNGVLNLVLAGCIMVGWPSTALWVPGVLLGISMFSQALALWSFTGSSNLLNARAQAAKPSIPSD